MKKDTKIKSAALLLFLLLVLLHLYPLSLNPADSVHDLGDPLLNTWIISWVQTHLFKNPLNLFDANIFYPLPNTLSYSEHLLPQAIFSLPIAFLFKNPILTYGFLFFFSYLLSAYAMFLLVRHLTKNDTAGIIGGIIFAFNTYQLNHTPQLQLLSSGLIPLSLLYLHKFFEDKKLKNSILFSLFFTLQALACVYYGLFFISILLIIIPIMLIIHYEEIRISSLVKLGIPMLFSVALLFLFSLPYLSLFKYFGFERGLAKGADIVNYLAPSPQNVFLGKKLASLGGPECFLFPGIAALFLAAFYICQKRKLFKNFPRIIRIVMLTIILIALIFTAASLISGGFTLNLGFVHISSHNLAKPASVVLGGLILYVLLSFIFLIFKKKRNNQTEGKNLFLYLFLSFWALLLSFGPVISFLGHTSGAFPPPFKWFYTYIPGFKGIRVPSRYAVFVILCVAVFAGYGVKYLLRKIKKKELKVLLICGLIIFINAEYLTIPQKIRFVPIKDSIPSPYKWLIEKDEDFAIIELPFIKPIGKESLYMYFSLFHKKKLVNGYSGFLPPSIDYIRRRFDGFPSWSSIDILKSLGVKYIVLHPDLWNEEIAFRKMNRLEIFQSDLKLVKEFNYDLQKRSDILKSFGRDYIYEVVVKEEEKKEVRSEFYKEISPSEWETKASANEHLLPFLKDKNLETRWNSEGPKKKGDFILVEFKEPKEITQVSLHLGRFQSDFALDFILEASLDGKNWQRIKDKYSPGEFTKDMIYSPFNPIQNLYLDKQNLLYLKIIHLGEDKTFWWSVAELKIYENQN